MRAESRVRALRSLPCRLNNTAICDALDGLVSDVCPPSTPPLTDLRSQQTDARYPSICWMTLSASLAQMSPSPTPEVVSVDAPFTGNVHQTSHAFTSACLWVA